MSYYNIRVKEDPAINSSRGLSFTIVILSIKNIAKRLHISGNDYNPILSTKVLSQLLKNGDKSRKCGQVNVKGL